MPWDGTKVKTRVGWERSVPDMFQAGEHKITDVVVIQGIIDNLSFPPVFDDLQCPQHPKLVGDRRFGLKMAAISVISVWEGNALTVAFTAVSLMHLSMQTSIYHLFI